MNFQVRITEGDIERVKELLKEYILCSNQVLIFHHQKENNDHHHAYFFDLNRTDQGIRKYLGHYLTKEKFSVKKTCGGEKRLPITLEVAYQYGTEKYLDPPVFVKDIEDNKIEVLKLRAEAYYLPFKERKLEHGDAIIVTKEIIKERQDKVWEKLLDQREKYKGKNIVQIKSMICAEWLNNGKAMPRQCDLHRYAMSLFYRLKYEDHEVPDIALENLFVFSRNNVYEESSSSSPSRPQGAQATQGLPPQSPQR